MSILPMYDALEFATALKIRRKELRLSRSALAEKVGLSTAAIQRYEATDHSRIKPSKEAYDKLCLVLSELHATGSCANSSIYLGEGLSSEISLSKASIEQLVLRIKQLGGKKVTIEF